MAAACSCPNRVETPCNQIRKTRRRGRKQECRDTGYWLSLSPAGRLQITIVEKKREKKKILKRVNVMMKMMAEKSFKRNAFDGSEFGETLTARKGKLLMSRSTF